MKADRILQLSLAALLGLFTFALYSALHETVVQAGDSAPDFSVTTFQGRTVTQNNFGGKLLLLNFWASWCPPCVEETPSMMELDKVMGPKGLVILAISVDQNKEPYERFLKRFGIAFQTAIDPAQTVNTRYGTLQYPESYLIDTSGKVVEKIIGPTNWSTDEMLQHVQTLLR